MSLSDAYADACRCALAPPSRRHALAWLLALLRSSRCLAPPRSSRSGLSRCRALRTVSGVACALRAAIVLDLRSSRCHRTLARLAALLARPPSRAAALLALPRAAALLAQRSLALLCISHCLARYLRSSRGLCVRPALLALPSHSCSASCAPRATAFARCCAARAASRRRALRRLFRDAALLAPRARVVCRFVPSCSHCRLSKRSRRRL